MEGCYHPYLTSAAHAQGEAKRAYRQVGEGIVSTVTRHLSGDQSWVVLEGVPAAHHRLEETSRPMQIYFIGCLQGLPSLVFSFAHAAAAVSEQANEQANE